MKQEGEEKTVKETEIVTDTQLQQIIDLHNNQIQKLQQEIEQTQDIRQQQLKQQQIRLHISQVQRLQRHMQQQQQQCHAPRRSRRDRKQVKYDDYFLY